MMKNRIILNCILALWALALSAQSWSGFDCHSFQYDMTIYYTLKNANLNNYEIAAFVGNKCRGVSEVVTATGETGASVTYGFLKVYSNESKGETVTFKFYNKERKREGNVSETSVVFTSMDAIGLPSEPLILELDDVNLGDANIDGSVTAKDIVAISNYLMGKSFGSFDEFAADMNNDNKIDIADIIQIVIAIMSADSSLDKSLTAEDVVMILKYLRGEIMGPFDEFAADMNADNKINIADIIQIVNTILSVDSSNSD